MDNSKFLKMIYLDNAFRVRGTETLSFPRYFRYILKVVVPVLFSPPKDLYLVKVRTTFSFVKHIFTRTEDLGCKMVSLLALLFLFLEEISFYSYF